MYYKVTYFMKVPRELPPFKPKKAVGHSLEDILQAVTNRWYKLSNATSEIRTDLASFEPFRFF